MKNRKIAFPLHSIRDMNWHIKLLFSLCCCRLWSCSETVPTFFVFFWTFDSICFYGYFCQLSVKYVHTCFPHSMALLQEGLYFRFQLVVPPFLTVLIVNVLCCRPYMCWMKSFVFHQTFLIHTIHLAWFTMLSAIRRDLWTSTCLQHILHRRMHLFGSSWSIGPCENSLFHLFLFFFSFGIRII